MRCLNLFNRIEKLNKKYTNVVTHQPNLFANPKVIQKLCAGDVWVVLDDVQFVRREWQNRCKLRNLKQPNQEFWLSASVCKAKQSEEIRNIKFADFEFFKENTCKQLFFAYGKSPNWDFIQNYLDKIFIHNYELVSDFCIDSTLIFLENIGIKIPVEYSSELFLKTKSTQRLVDICKNYEASIYTSGLGGKHYMDLGLFENEKIEIHWHQWKQPSYGREYDDLDYRNFSFLDFVARYDLSEVKQYFTVKERLKVNQL